jgi:ABC-2 type transport system permease protein
VRYLRLYLYFLRFSFSRAMEFRVDFFFRIFMDGLYYLIQFLFFKTLHLHSSLIAGWGEEQMTIFIAGFIFIDALHMTVFANNCWWFPVMINRGALDYYLTKPVSSFFFLSLREFAANSFLNLLMAIGILSWAISIYPDSLPFMKILGFIFFLILGTFLYFLVHMLFLLSVFWTQSPRGFSEFFYATTHAIERPDRIFKGIFRFLFVFILPFSVMASYPARFLLEDNTQVIVLTMLFVTGAFYAIVMQVWNRGLRSYSSASS